MYGASISVKHARFLIIIIVCLFLRKTLISIYIIYCSLHGRSKGSAAINMLKFKGVSSVNTSLSAATLFV